MSTSEKVSASGPPRKDAHIENVECDLTDSAHGRHTLACEYNGDRYHVWIDANSGELTSPPVLYKNPPPGMRSTDPGYYHTRHLRIGSRFSVWIIAEMRKVAESKGLRAAAEKRAEREAEEASVAAALAQREEVIRDTALDLYDAVKLANAAYCGQKDHGGSDPQSQAIRAVRAALAKVDLAIAQCEAIADTGDLV